MAAVTASAVSRPHVFGDRHMISATVVIATSGDTWVVPGFKTINWVGVTPQTALANGVTWSGNTITFLSAASTSQVMVIGI